MKDAPIEDIKKVDPVLAKGIERMRKGDVVVKPGYDGEFGVIKLFEEDTSLSEDQSKMF